MKTQYHVVSEYDRLDALSRPEDRRIEIDRRAFDREESAVAFARSLPCDIYAEPLDDADSSAVYAIRHTVYRADLDYDGFPVDTVLIGCRRLPDEHLPGAVKAYHRGDGSGAKYKGRWFPAKSAAEPKPASGKQNVEIAVRLPAGLYQRLARAAAASGKSPDEMIQAILQHEINNSDQEERPDPGAPAPEPGSQDGGMGVDWEE
jgi:hypothetical protein